MSNEQFVITIDGFRFIENLQTTARQLIVCTEIAKQLNNRQLPKRILEEMLIKWSLNEEAINQEYKESKGKITKDGGKTAALRYYFSLAESLGLIKGFNNVFIDTNISYTLLYFIEEHKEHYVAKKLCENIFYLYQLLNNDADGILLCVDQIAVDNARSQRELQSKFKETLNYRLVTKGDLASPHLKNSIVNKFRAVNYVWKKPEVYAEHIIAPRYEWLSTLGLVKINRGSKFTFYSLTEKGDKFRNACPKIGADILITDISEKWLSSSFFDIASLLYCEQEVVKFGLLPNNTKNQQLGASLERASKFVKSSISYRLPLINSYLFICMDLLVNQNIIINFNDIYESLNPAFTYNLKTYKPKISGRLNESYITITHI